MIYILAERKYFLSNKNGRIDNMDYDTYEAAQFDMMKHNPEEVFITNYDKPLYHGDYVIKRKSTQFDYTG